MQTNRSCTQQCSVLMWKNFLIKRRQYCTTFLEILFPVAVMCLMILFRSLVDKESFAADLRLDKSFSWPAYDVSTINPQIAQRIASDPWRYFTSVQTLNDMALACSTAGFKFALTSTNSAQAAQVTAFKAQFETDYPSFVGNTVTFTDSAALDTYVKSTDYIYKTSPILAAYVIKDFSGPDNYSYNIRLNQTQSSRQFYYQQVPLFLQRFDFAQSVEYTSQDISLFSSRGFMLMQLYMDNYIVKLKTGSMPAAGMNWSDPRIVMQPFPTPAYVKDTFATVISGVLGLLFTLAFIWPVSRMTRVLVEEKELKIKEGMKMMGLFGSALFWTWFLTYSIVFFIIALLITITTGSTVYANSDKVIIFFVFFMFGVVSFAFCFMMSTAFSKASTASTLSGLLFLFIYFGGSALNDESPASSRVMACLASPICFGQVAVTIAGLESNGLGLTSATLNTALSSQLSVQVYFSMMVVDLLLYLLIGLYFDAVVPTEWGVQLPYCFCCMCSFWCPDSCGKESNANEDDEALEKLTSYGDFVEKVSSELRVGVQINKLRKEFPAPVSGEPNFVAVNNLNLDIMEDQILALLGHNGAGKTTLINMMTGMLPPTSGECKVGGLSINDKMDEIRLSMGVCPQHNILFEQLTVYEHLYLYASIKGMQSALIEDEITRTISEVGLTEKRDAFSTDLSGGMKRKLSVAIALIGDSRIVFLDEPTSGMDAFSRRSTWEMLKKAKSKGRVIVLTTHFMDEADQLGDRIAIMAKGEVKCVGSSLFLKKAYGVGYTFTISKAPGFDSVKMTTLMNQRLRSAAVLSDVAGEISYQLPMDQSAQFPDLFDLLDKDKNLKVQNYGISVTTLEEVFLKVGHSGTAMPTSGERARGSVIDLSVNMDEKKAPTPVLEDRPPTPTEESDALGSFTRSTEDDQSAFCRHYCALLKKRYDNTKRNSAQWVYSFGWPALILLAGVALYKVGKIFSTIYETPMNFSIYNQPMQLPSNPAAYSVYNTYGSNLYGTAVDATSANSGKIVDFQNYLLATMTGQTKQSRFGALMKVPFANAPSVFPTFSATTPGYVINPVSTNTAEDYYVLFFNTTARISGPAIINMYSNLRGRSLASSATFSIQTNLQPLPWTANRELLNDSFVGIIVSIAFAFIPASYGAWAVYERQTKSKHQQMISGVSPWAYWLSMYTWDLINYIPMMVFALLIFVIVDVTALVGENAFWVFVIMLMYGLSIISYSYVCSFLFDETASAQSTLLLFYIVSGAILLIAWIVMTIIEDTRPVMLWMVYIFRLMPNFAFGEAMANLMTRQVSAFQAPKEPYAWEVIGIPCVYMAVSVPIFFLMTMMIEYITANPELLQSLSLVPEPSEKAKALEMAHVEDRDVTAERARVGDDTIPDIAKPNPPCDDMIVLKNLRKVYPATEGAEPKIAVKNLTFGVPKGQCFGFLGINGAGKTTSLEILTASINPTGGTAFLDGKNILSEQQNVRSLIGYCPQFDALLPMLTGRETLDLYASIKGVPGYIRDEFVEKMLKRLDLLTYADKPCGGYSGGNKRKLCVGVALIGNPPIVFLDEPSTGMDPQARRFMWDLISSTMQGRSVILTTHSMEECEALCQRIGIMVSGFLRCLGSSYHLKSRYGDAYQFDLHVSADAASGAETGALPSLKGKGSTSNNLEQGIDMMSMNPEGSGHTKLEMVVKTVIEWVEKTFPGSVLLEFHQENLKFQLPKVNTLSKIFRTVEGAKAKLGITEFSVAETSLEQIFIHFAKQQDEERGDMPGNVADFATIGTLGDAVDVTRKANSGKAGEKKKLLEENKEN